MVERLGKGFRGPPRDAWLAAIAPQKSRGYAFGVHKALDKAGAVLGPLVAYALLSWLGETPEGYKTLFWVAVVPAVASIVVLAFIQDRPGESHAREGMGQNLRLPRTGCSTRLRIHKAKLSLPTWSKSAVPPLWVPTTL